MPGAASHDTCPGALSPGSFGLNVTVGWCGCLPAIAPPPPPLVHSPPPFLTFADARLVLPTLGILAE